MRAPLPGLPLLLSFLLAVLGFGLVLAGLRAIERALPLWRLSRRVRRAVVRTVESLRSEHALEATGTASSEGVSEGYAPAPLDDPEPGGDATAVALRGVAALVEEGAPVDPLCGRPCVAYRLVVDRVARGRHLWEVVIRDADVRPFVLRDATGVARVVPDEAPHVEFRRPAARTERSVPAARVAEVLARYGLERALLETAVRTRTEHATIEVGTAVVAIGRAHTGTSGKPVLAGSPGAPLLLAELPSSASLGTLARSLARPLLVNVAQIAAGAVCVAQLLVFLFG